MTVHEAWTAVMADIGAVAKSDRNTHQKFDFRGIDAVLNAVGPVLRHHAVSVRPVSVAHQARDVQSSTGKPMQSVIVTVDYEIADSAGDVMHGCAVGEAFDAGDKATPKAMSVAFRTFLLQALCLPTDEPDPDHDTYEVAAPVDIEALVADARLAGVDGDFDAMVAFAAVSSVNASAAASKLRKAIAAKAVEA